MRQPLRRVRLAQTEGTLLFFLQTVRQKQRHQGGVSKRRRRHVHLQEWSGRVVQRVREGEDSLQQTQVQPDRQILLNAGQTAGHLRHHQQIQQQTTARHAAAVDQQTGAAERA